MIAGYLAALLIGLTLGLIGGGGSILTVPVLVYLLAVDPVTATAYSLFIVGATSLVAVYPKYQQQEVDLLAALQFGIPSLLMVFLTRTFILPAIPAVLFTVAGQPMTKGRFLLLIFALLMVAAAITMIPDKKVSKEPTNGNASTPFLFLLGMGEGLVSGLVGAGGGFLIIPVLVLFARLPMKRAVGTSLLIIAIKSLVGFAGDLSHHEAINWPLLLTVTGLSIVGILIGNYFSRRVPAAKLKKGFGWFVLLMGIYIFWREGRFMVVGDNKK
ncbi:MAG TPA: sulfite exporter TauE/SafE family protein [Flavihumibacter sp.]|nr:sulfite exporter TauE/SafE family protein [Flavihumibacter sp.]